MMRPGARAVCALAALGIAFGDVACRLDWSRYRVRDSGGFADGAATDVAADEWRTDASDDPPASDAGADVGPSCPTAITDPSFEEDPRGFPGRWLGFGATVTRESVADARSGIHVARALAGVPPGSPVAQWGVLTSLPATPAGTRRVVASAWVRLAPGSPPLSNLALMLIERRTPPDGGALLACQGNPELLVRVPSPLTSRTEWTRVEGTFDMPVAGNGCRIDVGVRHDGNAPSGGFELDDVTACVLR